METSPSICLSLGADQEGDEEAFSFAVLKIEDYKEDYKKDGK